MKRPVSTQCLCLVSGEGGKHGKQLLSTGGSSLYVRDYFQQRMNLFVTVGRNIVMREHVQSTVASRDKAHTTLKCKTANVKETHCNFCFHMHFAFAYFLHIF